MREKPSDKYRVIQRDGVLVVESRDEEITAKPRKSKFRLPRISLRQIGIDLFQARHFPDLTAESDAILSADSLQRYLKLDARSYDLYYITPIQQSLLGYLGIAQYLGVAAGLVSMVFGTLGFGWFLAVGFLALIGAILGWKLYIDHIEPIHGQQYEPASTESAAETAPAPSAPAPC